MKNIALAGLALTTIAFAQSPTGQQTFTRLVKNLVGEDLGQIHTKSDQFNSTYQLLRIDNTEVEGIIKVEQYYGGDHLRIRFNDGSGIDTQELPVYVDMGTGTDQVSHVFVYLDGSDPNNQWTRQMITWRQ